MRKTSLSALGGKEGREFKELQTKLCLFGDSFEHGKLKSCLIADDELRRSVLSLFLEVGKVLSKSKYCKARTCISTC